MDPIRITATAVANIESLLARRGWSRADLSRATNIAPPHITKLMKAESATSLDTIARVCEALGASPDELFGVLPLPVFGPVPCGPPAPVLDGEIRPDGWVNIAKMFGPADGLFLVKASGNSMLGAHIAPGDFLVIRSGAAAESGQKVLAEVGGSVTVKKFGRQGRKFVLYPCNDDHEPIVLDGKDDARIKGVVVGVIRKE